MLACLAGLIGCDANESPEYLFRLRTEFEIPLPADYAVTGAVTGSTIDVNGGMLIH